MTKNNLSHRLGSCVMNYAKTLLGFLNLVTGIIESATLYCVIALRTTN